MGKDNFQYKIFCELIIVSKEADVDKLTEELGISPSRFFRKGEKSISKHSGSIIIKSNNLWALRSETDISEEETINHHISFFKSKLNNKIKILSKYKRSVNYDISFLIWIETDNAGIGFEIKEQDLQFLNSISNQIKLSLITVENVNNERKFD